MDKTKVTKDFENGILVVERVFGAPVQAVWEAWSNSDKLASWWGPRGWETTIKEFDFRPGGTWLYCMKCVDKNQGKFYGQESWGKTIFKEITAPEVIVYEDHFSDARGELKDSVEFPASVTRLEMINEDGKTRLVSRTQYGSTAELEKVVNMGMIEGLTETFDKLEESLA